MSLEYLFPVVCLVLGWFLVVVEYLQQRLPPRPPMNDLDRWMQTHVPLSVKVQLLVLLSVVVLIIILCYPNGG